MGEVDWSGLPPELLNLISSKLPDISDFVRFRAVCKGWCSSVPIADPSPRLPWLLLNRTSYAEEDLSFYSLSTKKIHTFHVPEARQKPLYGPAHGYMIAKDDRNSSVSLLNPITRNEVFLPPHELRMLRTVGLGPNPIQSRDPVVVYGEELISKNKTFGFCRPPDENWTKVECFLSDHSAQTYYKGMYYLEESITGNIEVIDATTGVLTSVILPPNWASSGLVNLYMYMHLVESAGELLGVFQMHKFLPTAENCWFEIHRLENREERYRWVKMPGIGDQMLFLHYGHGFSLSAHGFVGLKGNCIYYMDKQNLEPDEPEMVYRYDIEDGTVEGLPCSSESGFHWIMPALF